MPPHLSLKSLQNCEKKVSGLGKFLLAHLKKRIHYHFVAQLTPPLTESFGVYVPFCADQLR